MYDYIIVGAGSAGCVLAARLTEDEHLRVLLIEAGPVDDAQEIHVPAAFSKLFQTKYDWSYLSECEPGLDGRRRFLPRGRMLGGSSSMNAMIYIRGNRRDYDAWAAAGAEQWGWDDVLPYFLRAEDFRGELAVARDRRAADRQRGPLAESADGCLRGGRPGGRPPVYR